LLNQGWIVQSLSPYFSPVICMRKKDRSLRLCCDYRELNFKSVPDQHPIPRIQDMLDSLSSSSWFSVLDQGKAYHQGFLDEESHLLTAFALYEWVRIPFGLSSAPTEFQRSMEGCLSGLRDYICQPYLDDDLVHSSDFEEHVKHVQTVLQRYQQHGVKLTARKCELFKSKVRFLGKMVSEQGYTMYPAEIAPVQALREKRPATIEELRKILGFLSYYRPYIQDFSWVARLLYDLLSAPAEAAWKKPVPAVKGGPQQKKRESKLKNQGHLSSHTPLTWISNHQQIIEQLIDCLSNPLILGIQILQNHLYCTASQEGLGAVLYQRTLTPPKKNYYMHSTQLADFNITIKYCPGKSNADADGLSRMSLDMDSYMSQCTEDIHQEDANHSSTFQPMPREEIQRAQERDLVIGRVLKYKGKNQWLSKEVLQGEHRDVWTKLCVDQQGILHWKTAERDQLVLPKEYHPLVFRELHQEMGHLGVEKTLNLIRDRFYWPWMQHDVEHYLTRVYECLKKKKPNKATQALLSTIKMTYPFEMVSINFLHLETCKQGYEYVLVVMHHYTRLAQAYATTNKSDKTVADKIFNDFALKFGFLSKIHHNMGKEFENQLFPKGCTEYSSHTTPYHPQGNGQVKKFNQTLLAMLRTLTEKQKADWKSSLSKVVHAYNCTRSEATGFSLFYLLFRQSPRLPINLLFDLKVDGRRETHQDYVTDWQNRICETYKITSKTATKEAARGKAYYDRRI
uniref:Gypsy retrotransposon integrase-like protein 1 n=1 Tax=Latimeria chalumnae TaxID=7897 RepID=H3B5S1_LATCH